MPNTRIAGRYAKSLVVLAQEQQQLDAVNADMKYLSELCRMSPDFRNVLRSPIIKAEKKEAIVKQVIEAHISKLSAAFIHLLITKGREANLPEIAAAVIEQYNEIRGIHRVKLTTATPVSDALKDAIVAKLKSEAHLHTVELENEVKEAIIGGFQLEYMGNLVDASVARDLRDIQKQFQNNIYVPNIR